MEHFIVSLWEASVTTDNDDSTRLSLKSLERSCIASRDVNLSSHYRNWYQGSSKNYK